MIRPLPRLTTYWILAAVMLAALLLRVSYLGITPYNIDEAAASIFASQIAHLKAFPLVGIETSQGFHNPPLFIYLLAPFFTLTPDPRFAMFFFAMFGTAAVGLTGLTARRLWGGWAAIIAALLVCFSPTAIEHSRRLWGHDLIIFWSALSIYCMLRSIQSGRRRWSWTALTAAAAAQACHLSGVTLWIVPVGMLLLARPRGWKLSLLIGAGVLVLIYLPWVAHDLGAGRGAEAEPAPVLRELKLIFGVTAGDGPHLPQESPAPAIVSWIFLLGDSGGSEILSEEYGRFISEEFVFGWLHGLYRGVLALLLVGGVAALLHDAWRLRVADRAASRWAGLLAASALAPMVLFTILPVTAVPSYQLPAFVPGVLAATFVLIRGPQILQSLPWRELRGRRLPTAILIAALVITGWFALHATSFTIASRTFVSRAGWDEFVAPVLEFKLDAATFISASSDRIPYAIMQDGRAPATGVDYWVLYLHWYASGDPRAPTLRSAPQVFLILDNRAVLREPPSEFLAPRDFTRFGTMRVYRLFQGEAEQWRLLTETYPSSPAVTSNEE